MIETVERRGEVVGLEHGMARVRLEAAASACSGCGSRGSCASGAASQVIDLRMPKTTRLGDRVVVSTSSSSVAAAGLLGYLLPSASLLLGAVVAASFFDGDGAAVLGAATGFVAGLLTARVISRFAIGQSLATSACNPDSNPGELP